MHAYDVSNKGMITADIDSAGYLKFNEDDIKTGHFFCRDRPFGFPFSYLCNERSISKKIWKKQTINHFKTSDLGVRLAQRGLFRHQLFAAQSGPGKQPRRYERRRFAQSQ